MRKSLFLLLYAVFVLGLLESGSRCFWMKTKHVPFTRPEEIIYVFYPELKPVRKEEINKNDGYYDVLLLAGSVLNRKWGKTDMNR